MANKEHLKILKSDGSKWNAWRKKNKNIKPNLRNANLRVKDLSGYDLSGVNFRNADLSWVNFEDAILEDVDLTDAFLYEAYLENTDFRKAILDGTIFENARLARANFANSEMDNVNFTNADLEDVNMTGATLTEADFTRASLVRTDFSDADLEGSIFDQATMIETNFSKSKISGSSVYGVSAWDLILDGTRQNSLVITREDQAIITVDNLELAQFIYMLLNHKNLRQVLNSVTEKGVLILGRFGGGGIETLYAVADKLRDMKFLPIIFDFDCPKSKNYTETVKTLAGLSRFVIADLSGPSVPQELYATVPHYKIPFILILETGKRPHAMLPDILEYDWVVKPVVEFDSTEHLIKQLPSKIVKKAEKKHERRQKLLNELFGK